MLTRLVSSPWVDVGVPVPAGIGRLPAVTKVLFVPLTPALDTELPETRNSLLPTRRLAR